MASALSGCSQYVSALKRDEQTNKVLGGIMRYPQGFQADMARDQAAAMGEAHRLCSDNESAERVRGFDGVGTYGVLGLATTQSNSEFFEFRCVPMKRRKPIPLEPDPTTSEKPSWPVCTDADRAERRKAGMSESAIERACQ